MNNRGYSIRELIILFGALAVVFAVLITKGSYALSEINDDTHFMEEQQKNIVLAAELYTEMYTEEIVDEETFIYASDLVDLGILTDIEEYNYDQTKIKITKLEDGSYNVEVVS